MKVYAAQNTAACSMSGYAFNFRAHKIVGKLISFRYSRVHSTFAASTTDAHRHLLARTRCWQRTACSIGSHRPSCVRIYLLGYFAANENVIYLQQTSPTLLDILTAMTVGVKGIRLFQVLPPNHPPRLYQKPSLLFPLQMSLPQLRRLRLVWSRLSLLYHSRTMTMMKMV